MRVLVAFAVVAAAVVLAGCSSQDTNSPVDPERAEPEDAVAPAIVFGVLAVVGLLALVVVLRMRRRRRERRDEPPSAPPGKTGP